MADHNRAMADRKPPTPKPAPTQSLEYGHRSQGSTGPVTAKGKAKSAGNALTHGATSPKLLNDEELVIYQCFIEALRKQYPSQNPLVHMQLERISRLKVQLDRIQTVIDASFVAERQAAAEPGYAPPGGKTREERSSIEIYWRIHKLLAKYTDGYGVWLDQFEKTLLAVCQELNALDSLDRLTTHEDFQEYLPSFCHYLLQVAQDNRQSLGDAVAKIRHSPYAIPDQALGKSPGSAGPRPSSGEEEKESPYSGPVQDITAVSVEDLLGCATQLQEQMNTFLKRMRQAEEYDSRLELQQAAAIPDPEKLDRLMRYQTTINRQLSSAMGELLQLVRIG